MMAGMYTTLRAMMTNIYLNNDNGDQNEDNDGQKLIQNVDLDQDLDLDLELDLDLDLESEIHRPNIRLVKCVRKTWCTW